MSQRPAKEVLHGQLPYIRPLQAVDGKTGGASRHGGIRFKKNVNFHPRIYMEHIGIGRVLILRGNIEERACELATYIIENRTTVREAARRFGISKSTVHKDIQERLPLYNRSLYLQVKEVLDENKAQRHIRGGIATRRKYCGARK